MSIGKHQSARMLHEEWLTPPFIIEDLGPFDLDPCAPVVRPWDTATKHYTYRDNGLNQEWEGFVWLNPPYGKEAEKWLARLAHHGNGIALIFARTETRSFFKNVWNEADAVYFVEGRLTFHHPNGIKAAANSGAPSCLAGYGPKAVTRLMDTKVPGQFIRL